MFDYTKNVTELILKAEQNNEENIKKVAELIEKTIIDDKIIHAFGTGHAHMLGI